MPALFTIKDLVSRHEWLREATLRKVIFEDRYGFNKSCVVRFGRRVLIDETKFLAWLQRNGTDTGAYA